MLKVKQPKNIPQEINRFNDAVNGREYAAMQALFAVLSTYQVAGPVLEARLRKLGGGVWRDFRMIQVKMEAPVRETAERLIQEQIPHHYVMVWDDIYDALKQTAALMDIPVIEL